MTSYIRVKSGGSSSGRKAKKRRQMAKRRPCAACGKYINPMDATVDHIVPRSKGGVGEAWNLRPMHQACNSARGAIMEDTVEVRNAAYVHRLFGLCALSRTDTTEG